MKYDTFIILILIANQAIYRLLKICKCKTKAMGTREQAK